MRPKQATDGLLLRALFIAFMAATWLLPNHTEPWKVFVQEAWMAATLLLATLFALTRSGRIEWTAEPLFILAVACIPWLQYLAGLLPFVGQAAIDSTYLAAAALAWLVGYQVQRHHAFLVGDVLFTALVAGAAFSGAIGIYQWLGLQDPATLDVWIIVAAYSGRATGNLGQPNHLGTLLVLGTLGIVWGMRRRAIGPGVGMLAIGFLLAAIVPTQSRTALLEVALLVGALLLWRKRLPDRRLAIWAVAGFVVFLLCFLNISVIERWIGLAAQASMKDRVLTEVRPAQWRMFFEASWLSPWVGFGWNQVIPAELGVADYPAVLQGMIFAEAHNLFIDFILWTGWPLGIILSVLVVRWYAGCARRLHGSDTHILFLALTILLLHSLLEFPLHYLYFSIPFFAMAGAMRCLQGAVPVATLPARVGIGGWVAACALYGLLLSDVFAVERGYLSLRLELAGIDRSNAPPAPPIRLLNHMETMIDLARWEITEPVSDRRMAELRGVIDFHPSSKNMLDYAAALALRGDKAASQAWLDKSCRVVPTFLCRPTAELWTRYQQKFPVLQDIRFR